MPKITRHNGVSDAKANPVAAPDEAPQDVEDSPGPEVRRAAPKRGRHEKT